jgi:hypothetical protein
VLHILCRKDALILEEYEKLDRIKVKPDDIWNLFQDKSLLVFATHYKSRTLESFKRITPQKMNHS